MINFMNSLFTVTATTKEVERVNLFQCKQKDVKDWAKGIQRAFVKETSKDGDTWLDMCFVMADGHQDRMYLSKYSDLEDGDEVNVKSIELIQLEDENGNLLKTRVDGKLLD